MVNDLNTQIQLQSNEINGLKTEFENIYLIKERKNNDLQNIVNQSLYSYNTGLNNIKIANKLDDEIKTLMNKLKLENKENS